MIIGFADKETEKVWLGTRSKQFEAIARAAQRKLIAMELAVALDDLRSPPGNQLEALKGNREGQHSIRINGQYRICFVWDDKEKGFKNVEIVDYH